jgi:S-DNA-T family DNA segregation ATPase FtsK/SpoIIIE
VGIDITVQDADGSRRDLRVGTGAGSAYPGARIGAVVGAPEPPRPPAGPRLEVVGGPDCGQEVALGRDAVTIGRDPSCQLVLRDPDVSRRHALISRDLRGWHVQDLGSRNGTKICDRAARCWRPVGPTPQPLPAESLIAAGASTLRLTGAQPQPARVRPGTDGTLVVGAGAAAAGPPATTIAFPPPPTDDQPRAPLGWLAALVPAALAVCAALWMGAPQFAVFAGLTPLTLAIGWLGDRRRTRRRAGAACERYRSARRAAEQALTRSLVSEFDHRHADHPGPPGLLRESELPGTRLWCRQPGDGLHLRLGLGTQPARLQVREGSAARPAASLDRVPIAVDLAAGPLGLTGPAPVLGGVGRWLIGQLCATYPPSCLQLAVLLSADVEAQWRWARWLPHLTAGIAIDPAARRAVLADLATRVTAAPDDAPYLLLLVDRVGEVATVPGLLELLRDGPSRRVSALCLDERAAALPAACAAVATVVGETGSELLLERRGAAPPSRAVADRVSPAWAERLARALAPLREPAGHRSGVLPDAVRLLDLLGADSLDPQLTSERWRRAAADPGSLVAVLGVAASGPLAIDLARDGPHALVAGTTGSGKSELLRCLLGALAARHAPDEVTFVLIDYKGGATFAECAGLPHTVGVVTDLDPLLAARALQALDSELDRRERLFAAVGCADVVGYRRRAGEALPRLVIVVDEFAELAGELGDFVTGLITIARRGRSLGVHLVLATQRPGGVVSPEIRANTAIRIALRMSDPDESLDVIDSAAAARISRHTPGRAYVRIGGAPPVAVQCAQLAGRPADPARVEPLDAWRRPLPAAARSEPVLPALAATLRAAAVGRSAPRAPWLPPLPAAVPTRSLPVPSRDTAVAVGLLDLPVAQAQPPLVLDLAEPTGLLLAGAARSGRSTALRTLAMCAATRLPPDRLVVYAIDSGGGLSALRALPHCAALIERDPESAAVLLSRLGEPRTQPRSDPRNPLRLLLLDGWEAFAAASEEFDAGRSVRELISLALAAPSAGLTVAVTGGRDLLTGRLPGALGTRLVLRLNDPGDYALAGLAAVPGSALGPGRCRRAGDGAVAQLAQLADVPQPVPGTARLDADADAVAAARVAERWSGRSVPASVPRVRSLPDRIELTSLRPVPGQVLLGVGGGAAEPLAIDPAVGQGRLLVAGPPRSGRSSLVRSLLVQLVATGRRALVAAPDHSPAAAAARELAVPLVGPADPGAALAGMAPEAVLVDDCEVFLDTAVGDALAALTRTAGRALPVIAAGGADEFAISFRGIGAEVRRGRCAVLLAPRPVDGELAGVRLAAVPHEPPPGRGVVIGDPAWGAPFRRGPVRVQVALPPAASQPICGYR